MLLIFDWDGTLVDSADRIISCLQQAADTSGYPVCDTEAIRDIIGLGLPEAMNRLYPQLIAADHEKIRQHYVRHFLAADQEPSPFFDGVLEGLQQLRDRNYLLAVATGKSRRGMDRILASLAMTDFFHSTRCADESASKPHPLMLSELLEQFAKSSQEAIMVGDTEYDMAMALTLGMPRVAVSYGAHDLGRLQTYKPRLCIDHFSEFVRWIEQEY